MGCGVEGSDGLELPKCVTRDEVRDVSGVEVCMARVDSLGASAGAVAFVSERDCGGGCGEDGCIEGGEASVVAVGLVGSIDGAVAEEFVLRGKGLCEGDGRSYGRDVEAKAALNGGREFAGVHV